MTRKRILEEAPASAGADAEPGQASPASLVVDATPGRRREVARAYGHAAAWIKCGRPLPPELAAWTAERLEALVKVLMDKRTKKPADAVLVALGVSEKGKRGNKRRSDMEARQQRDLVLDVVNQRAKFSCTLEEAYAKVVAFHEKAGHRITETQVEAAWKVRKRLFPEMDS